MSKRLPSQPLSAGRDSFGRKHGFPDDNAEPRSPARKDGRRKRRATKKSQRHLPAQSRDPLLLPGALRRYLAGSPSPPVSLWAATEVHVEVIGRAPALTGPPRSSKKKRKRKSKRGAGATRAVDPTPLTASREPLPPACAVPGLEAANAAMRADVDIAPELLGAPASFGVSDLPELPEPVGAPADFCAAAQLSGMPSAPAVFDPVALVDEPLPRPAPLPTVVPVRPAAAREQRLWPFVVVCVACAALPLLLWLPRPLVRPGVSSVAEIARPPVDAPLSRPPVEPPPPPELFTPLAARAPEIVVRGSAATAKVALTFDGCSTPTFVGWDERVADILERYEVAATFFLGGRFIRARPDIVRVLADNPLFELQGHTFLHPHLPELSKGRIVRELVQTDEALFDVVGRRATLFRPPFGEYSTDVVRAATAAGYLPIQYDIASGDPDPAFRWNKLMESILTQVRPGSIVVLHANGHGVHTVEALPLIIDALRQRGFELTTVSDLLAEGGWEVDDGRKGPRRNKTATPPRLAARTPPPAPPVDTEDETVPASVAPVEPAEGVLP